MGAVKQSTIKPSKAKPLPQAPEAPALKAKPIPEPTEARRGAKGVVKPATPAKVVEKPAPVMKLSIALDSPAAKIEAFITALQKRGAKMDVDIHSAACATLNHTAKHNDPTLLNRLIAALPKGTRSNAVIIWAMKYGNVAMNDAKDAGERKLKPLVFMKGKKADIEAAVATPFWLAKGIKEGGTEWLYSSYIENVMKTLKRHAEDVKSPEHTAALAAYDALSNINKAMNVPKPAVPLPTAAAPVDGATEPTTQDRRATDAVH